MQMCIMAIVLVSYLKLKSFFMKTNFTQQEILLMTNTTLSQSELCEKDIPERNKHLSRTEQLEEACWNGLLDELLPEIIEKSSAGKRLYLWQIRHAKSFLEIQLGEHASLIEQQFSIDPYLFMPTVFYS
jgi:hypothetical protein